MSTYTKVTEDVFNTVRHMQVVKTYPTTIIRQKTGVSEAYQWRMRQAKNWQNWVASHPQLAKRQAQDRDMFTQAIGAEDTLSLFDKITTSPARLPEHTCATRADLSKLTHATATTETKLFDEIKQLRLRDAANSRSVTNLSKATSESMEQAFQNYADNKSSILHLQAEMENVRAFMELVHASPFLSGILRRSARRLPQINTEQELTS